MSGAVRCAAPGLAAAALLAAAACSHDEKAAPPAAAPPPPSASPAPVADATFRFVECAAEQGVAFTQYCGATGEYFDPETMAGGGGFFDADNDGDLDLFLVNGCSFPPKAGDPTHAYFRNDGHGHFTNATHESGFGVVHRGMGCVAADVDNDGDQDLLVTGVGRTLLFSNRDGKFDEISGLAGIPQVGWTTASSFFDADGDGVLDLALGRYVQWSEAIDRKLTEEKRCVYARGTRDYCPVLAYAADHPLFLRGRGDATFQDATRAAGLADASTKALGMLVLDADDDGRLDFLIANDTLPMQLFRNRGDGTFTDVGLESGVALDHWGRSNAGMGVAADFTRDGALGIAVGNFSGEAITYHRQQRDAQGRLECEFAEISAKNGLRRPTLKDVTFGVVFADFDRDGDDDLVVSNGHVGRMGESDGVPYAQPARLFRRDGETFTEIALDPKGLGAPVVGRGLAAGDFDGDGDVDLLQLVNQGRARLFRNERGEGGAAGANPRGALRVLLRGAPKTSLRWGNADGIGALVTVTTGGRVQRKRRIVGDSYLSMSEPTLTFGLGDAPAADEVEVLWPSGVRDLLKNVPAGSVVIVEGSSGATPNPPRNAEPRLPPSPPAVPSLDALPFPDLEKLARERPDDLPTQKALGLRALKELRLDVAQRALDRAVALAPDDPAANWQQLRVVSMRADPATLQKRVAALFDRFGFEVMTLSAWSYLAGESADLAAAAVLDEALARRPDSASLHAQKAGNLLAQKRNADALAEYRKSVALDPTDWRSQLSIAWIALTSGDAPSAESAARAALAHQPGSPEALKLLAQSLHAQHRDADAPIAYEQHLAKDPDDLPVRADLIELLQSLDRPDAVEKQLTQLTTRNPKDARAWRILLDVRLEGADAATLGAAAQQALAACSESPDVLVRCARAELRVGKRRDVALSLVDKALQIDPTHAEAKDLRAKLKQ